MRESTVRATTAPRAVPFDMAAIAAMPRWREDLAWPLAMAPLQAAVASRQRALLEAIGALPHEDNRRTALLAAGRCVSSASALLEAALLVQAEHATGLRIAGGPPELDWLRGDSDVPPSTPQRLGQPGGASNAMFLRRLARTASWTPWWRLPAATLAPDITAVTHNAMLREAAAQSEYRVVFLHGDSLLEAWTKDAPAADVPDSLAETLTSALCAEPGLTGPMRARLAALVRPKIDQYVAQAARDMAALGRAPALPKRLWSGSGGNYPARALGLEVMRRGGEVVRFDHGGSTGMIDTPDPLTLRETSVSTRFVVPTEAIAALCRAQDAAQPVPGLPLPEIAHGAGEPHLRGAAGLAARPGSPRPKVVYATGALYGFRQLIPPVLRDPVYLDWQLRMAEMLASLPVEMLLKPHPEGIFRGRRHPLADAGPTTSERFETVMADSDVFIFDFALSTAFWTALCSDRPIVFVDLGLAPFSPVIRTALQQRCHVVTARWDSDNMPRIARDALGQAIDEAARMRPDPGPFRRLLAGP